MRQLMATRTGEHSFSNSPGFLLGTQHNNETTHIVTHVSFKFPSTFCPTDVLLKTQTYSTDAVFLVANTGLYLLQKFVEFSVYFSLILCYTLKTVKANLVNPKQMLQHMELRLLLWVILYTRITYICKIMLVTWVYLALFGQGTEQRYFQSITSIMSNLYWPKRYQIRIFPLDSQTDKGTKISSSRAPELGWEWLEWTVPWLPVQCSTVLFLKLSINYICPNISDKSVFSLCKVKNRA